MIINCPQALAYDPTPRPALAPEKGASANSVVYKATRERTTSDVKLRVTGRAAVPGALPKK